METFSFDPFDARDEDRWDTDRYFRPEVRLPLEPPEPVIPESKLSRPLQKRIGKGPFKQSTPVMIRLELDDKRDAMRHLKQASTMATLRHQIPAFGIYAALLPNKAIQSMEEDPGVRRVFFDAEVPFPGPTVEFARAAFDFQPRGFVAGKNLQTIRNQVSTLIPAAAGTFSLGAIGNRPASTEPQPSWTPTTVTRDLLGSTQAASDGIDGTGAVGAVLDTGLPLGRTIHPQLSGMAYTSWLRAPLPDRSGHGSHVSSIAAGGHYVAPNGMELLGVAPGASILGIKVLETPLGIGRDSDILKGLEIALEQRVNAVNMSLGSEGYDPDNPFEEALLKLIAADVIPIAAAGNSGPGEKTIGTPGGSPHCIAVGSVNSRSGKVAEFSSRGPTEFNAQIKPDVVSYGGDSTKGNEELIYSTTSPGSTLDKLDGRVVDQLAPAHGTSQATPHFFGLVLLWCQYAKERLGRRLSFADVWTIFEKRGGSKDNEVGVGLAVYDWVTALGG